MSMRRIYTVIIMVVFAFAAVTTAGSVSHAQQENGKWFTDAEMRALNTWTETKRKAQLSEETLEHAVNGYKKFVKVYVTIEYFPSQSQMSLSRVIRKKELRQARERYLNRLEEIKDILYVDKKQAVLKLLSTISSLKRLENRF